MKKIIALFLLISFGSSAVGTMAAGRSPGTRSELQPANRVPMGGSGSQETTVAEAFRRAAGKTAAPDQLAPGDFAEVRKRTASDLFTEDRLGRSVSVSGNTAVAGAPNDNTSPRTDDGSAYVFERNVGGAEGWTEVRKLSGLTPDGFEEFGYSVAISGNTIVVGKRYEIVSGVPRAGSAYVFERNLGGPNNWGLAKTLKAAGATTLDGFGQAVTISGDRIAVGAPGENVGGIPNRGAAYVFHRNAGGSGNWGQVARVVAADGAEADQFGSSVSISGGTLVCGANQNSVGSFTFEGAAYVFDRNEGGPDAWGQMAKLRASDASQRSHFGWSVAVHGTTLVVGNYPYWDGFESNGAAYVFERDAGGAGNWGQVKRLTAGDGQLNDYFGQSVAVRGDVIAVGAIGDDEGASIQRGAVYVFERNYGGAANWGERQKLVGSDSTAHDELGNSVAVDGKIILAGASLDDFSGPVYHQNAGSAFFFVRETVSWVGNAKSVTAACTVDDEFGRSVAVDGEFAVVGTPYADVGGAVNAGSAYVFRRVGNGWVLVRTLTASDPAGGAMLGISVAISGETVAVGAIRRNGGRGAVYVFSRNAGGSENWGETRRIDSSDPNTVQWFGYSLDVDATRLVVGSPLTAVGKNAGQGAVFVFERDAGGAGNWGETRKITAPDGAASDKLGESVALSGDRIIAGAPLVSLAEQYQGAAYVFELDEGGSGNWGMKQKLVPPAVNFNMQFGVSVDISDGNAVVGAWNEKIGNATQQGAAYVFGRDAGGPGNWGQVRKIVAGDGSSYDYFGRSVAVSSDRIVVGGECAGSEGCRGSAYLFERNSGGPDNWGETRKLTAADGRDRDRFGLSVAIDADDIVVGVPKDELAGATGLGTANAFLLGVSGWTDLGKISPPLPVACGADDDYGFSVSVDGDTAVIGAPKDDIGASSDQGSAYVLERNAGGPNAWGIVRVLTASDGAPGDSFGSSVKVSGDTIAVGAYQDDVGGEADQGSVYLFERNLGGLGNWGEARRVTIAGGAANQRVGKFTALDGDTLAVGYLGDDSNTGAVHIFGRNAGGPGNWAQTRVVRPSVPQVGQQFGISISISGDTMAVGSNLKLINFFQSGAVYVLERDLGGSGSWGESKVIGPGDAATLVGFGLSVDLDGDRLAVGAPRAIGVGEERPGAVYLLERNSGGADNWGQVRKVVASDAADGDRFGESVAIDGESFIAGAPLADIAANADQGAAYVFRQNQGGNDNWGEARKLFAGDGAAGDEFGVSVDLSGENFLVGAYLARLMSSARRPADLGISRNGAGYFYGEASFTPTAAAASVEGRVADVTGAGVPRARVRITGPDGDEMTVATNGFGRFRFDSVRVGTGYVVSVDHKELQFAPQVVNVDGDIAGLEFVGY